jgi:uncharacterized protein YceK
MRDILLIVSVCLLIQACATAGRTKLPDGSAGYAVECSGSVMSWADCQRKAGEVCVSGYSVVDRNESPLYAVGAAYYAYSAAGTATRSMLIKCN